MLNDSSVVICLVEELLCYSIFSNILKNAIEASYPNSQVSIGITQGDEHAFIQIHNDKAVPVVLQNLFFLKYVTHGKVYGTGIGTYSAELLTEIQNGEIRMQTDKVKGTDIIIKFEVSQFEKPKSEDRHKNNIYVHLI